MTAATQAYDLRRVQHMTLLYDETCGFCERCRNWLAEQPKHLPMRFLAIGSEEARAAYPQLNLGGPKRELTVITSDGRVYRDDTAWIVSLWALKRYRGLSRMLAKPGMQGLARRAYQSIAENRHAISERWGLAPTWEQREALHNLKDAPEPPRCATE